jgi:chromosome segregation protein
MILHKLSFVFQIKSLLPVYIFQTRWHSEERSLRGEEQVRLKKISLKGFKSFADRTEVVFDGGVTAIVGPNGCGKSNIVDAFRWVMGEQSARCLRGDKMMDVLYAGSTMRRPAEDAEVSLLFTEVGNALPVVDDEVEIVRRLKRSGESEYFLNGQLVRQRDIHSLFWDSGLGKDAVAIFEQGKIEEIVLLSPQERRDIFDQVAGIRRFRERRKEAMRKLTQMEGNLTRLQDLLHEEKRRLKGLERQVAEATQYRDKRERLRLLEVGLLGSRRRSQEEAKEEIEKSLAEHNQRLADRQAAIATLEGELQQRLERAGALDEQLKTSREKSYQSQSQQQVGAMQQEASEQRLEELNRRLEELQEQQRQLAAADRRDQQTALELERSLEKLLETESEAQGSLRSAEELAEGVQQEVDALRQQQRAAQQHGDSLISVAHLAQSHLREWQLRLDMDSRRFKDLTAEESNIRLRLEQVRNLIVQRREAVGSLSQLIDERKKSLTSLAVTHEEKRLESRNGREELERLSMSLAEARARQQLLRRLQEQQEGLTAGAKSLLKESGESGNPLFGGLRPLTEALEIPTELEEAAAVVLAKYARTLVVDSEALFNLAVRRARQLQLTDISLATRGTIENLLQRLQVVEEKELKAGCVTAEGLFLDEHGVVFFPVRGEQSSIVREAELKRLATTLKNGQGMASALEARLAELASQTQKLRTEREELELAQRRDEMKLVEVNFGLQQVLSEERETNLALQKIGEDLQQVTGQLTSIKAELPAFADQETVARRTLAEHRESSAATEVGVQEALTKLRRFLDGVRQKDGEYQSAVRLRQETQRQRELLRARLAERSRHAESLQEQLQQNRAGKQRVKEAVSASVALRQQAESSLRQAEAELRSLTKELEEEQHKAATLKSRTAEEIEFYGAEKQQMSRLELLLEQATFALSELEQELRHRFDLAIENLPEVPLDFSPVAAEEEVRQLRRDLNNATSVNLGAVEQFEIQQKGFQALSTQVEDLVNGKRELTKLISQLDRTSRRQFKEAFEQVRANFQEQFKILFNGGEADLTFTDSEDPLEAGIDIVAKPPGKQMRSISLLSGGEKCLTAMALLFGIFQVKPSPFCILDEMDAPLDDSNIARFLQVVEPFLLQTQFIVVTHNKRTMAVADRLVGVSMEDEGISKLISVAFEKNESHADRRP